MTIILTLFGLGVFFVSLFTVGFKSAFKRLALFAITGVIIDAALIGIATAVAISGAYF